MKIQGRAVTRNDFVSEFWMFFCAKKTKNYFQMQQSNIPSDLKKSLEPLNNQPKSFSGRR